ncbi:sensor histidine kinase [Pedobacter glucosidilyticus]|uniref:sensor histidine kinase n=1 Tax=Pedobacter glucosidilyticus TaxID=1122941 RepID=UPI00047DF83A|nr:sensor histidine kinase [Pedobacter glucosidilyticus]
MVYSYHELIKPSGKSLWKHLLFWFFYITYEIFITRYVAHVKAHFLDYLLHYVAYIAFFYAHIYLLFLTIKPGKIYYLWLSCGVLIEIILLYVCNTGIYYLLQSLAIPTVAVSPLLVKSFMTTVYRAILLMILSTGYFLAIFSLVRQQHALIAEREAERLRADLAVAELAFLKAQIKPHFLFNRLFELYEDLKSIDLAIANRIMSMAELMQYAIVADSSNVKIPLKQELQYIKNYLFLQQQRYPKLINAKLLFDDEVENLKIIPLLLITLIENVFDHADLDGPHQVSIAVTVRADTIAVHIHNKVRAITPRRIPGIGLANLKDRLAHYYSGAYHFSDHTYDGYYHAQLSIYLK